MKLNPYGGTEFKKTRIINTHLFSFQTLVAVSNFSKITENLTIFCISGIIDMIT